MDASWGKPERRLEGAALRRRQEADGVQKGQTELVQPGERQFHLRLDPRSPDDNKSRGDLEGVLHERGLADTWLAAKAESFTATAAGRNKNAVNRLALSPTAVQHQSPTAGHPSAPSAQG